MDDINAPQPRPQPSTGHTVWDLVLRDMMARDQAGREKYGTPLRTHNGRDALVDAYQEALDLVVYLRQAIAERDMAPESIRWPMGGAGCGELRLSYGQRLPVADDPPVNIEPPQMQAEGQKRNPGLARIVDEAVQDVRRKPRYLVSDEVAAKLLVEPMDEPCYLCGGKAARPFGPEQRAVCGASRCASFVLVERDIARKTLDEAEAAYDNLAAENAALKKRLDEVRAERDQACRDAEHQRWLGRADVLDEVCAMGFAHPDPNEDLEDWADRVFGTIQDEDDDRG